MALHILCMFVFFYFLAVLLSSYNILLLQLIYVYFWGYPIPLKHFTFTIGKKNILVPKFVKKGLTIVTLTISSEDSYKSDKKSH